jgi:hypothetical protein
MNSCAISQSLDAILISGLVAAGLEFTMNKVRSDLRKIVHLQPARRRVRSHRDFDKEGVICKRQNSHGDPGESFSGSRF